MRLFLSSLRSNSGNGGVIVTPPNPAIWQLPVNSARLTIITGQSNASGEGLNSEALSTEIDVTSKVKIWRSNNNNFADLNIASGNNYPNNTAKHGFELQLSNIYETLDYPLYLAKRGEGGKEIIEMLKGGTTYQDLYNNFVIKAVNNLLASGKRVFVDIIFMQGEGDSDFQDRTNAYSSQLDVWMNLWRTNLGANLPISLVEIYQRNARTTTINQIFASKASSLVKVISASNLTTNDGIHYSYASLKTIINRYYDVNKFITPLEILTPLAVPTDTTRPATMTLNSVTQVGATLTVVANINGGDAVTSNSDLWFKFYCGFPVYSTTGKVSVDPNISISDTTVTIVNIPAVYRFTYNFSIVAVDEAGNNSVKSNVIALAVTT
jgi:hypothetical protein